MTALLTPTDWSVIASIATAGGFVIGGGAAVIALIQILQNRTARLEQSRPYVVAQVVPSPVTFHFLDIVIENVGAGPAHEVRIKATPPFRRVREEPGFELENARVFTEPIAMLPPGFSLRMFFDSAIDRNDAGMPDRHDVEVTYSDGRGHVWTDRWAIDLNLLEGALFTEEYGLHHVAMALQGIEKILKNSKTLKEGFHVVTEDRATYRARLKEERDHRRGVAEMRARLDPEMEPEGSRPEG